MIFYIVCLFPPNILMNLNILHLQIGHSNIILKKIFDTNRCLINVLMHIKLILFSHIELIFL